MRASSKPAGDVELGAAEELELALGLLAAAGHGAVDDRLVHGEQALAGVTERIEGPRLDERLDGPLVQDVRVDPFTEVVEVGERAVGLALADDGVHESFADVAHGRKPERNRALARSRDRSPRQSPIAIG